MRFQPGYLVLILASRSGLPSSAASRFSPNAQSPPRDAANPCHCVVGVICPCAGVGPVMIQQPSTIVTGIPVMMVQQPVVSIAASVDQSAQPCPEKAQLDKILQILERMEGRLNPKKRGGLRGKASDVLQGGQSYPPIGLGSELVKFVARNLAKVTSSSTKPGDARSPLLLTDMKSPLAEDIVLPLLLLKDGKIELPKLPKLERLIAEVDKMDMGRLFTILRWAKVRVDRTVMSKSDQGLIDDLIKKLEARFRQIAPPPPVSGSDTPQIDYTAIQQKLDDAEKQIDQLETVEALKAHKGSIEAIDPGNDMWYHADQLALIEKVQAKIEAVEAKASRPDAVVSQPQHPVAPPASSQGTSDAAREALMKQLVHGVVEKLKEFGEKDNESKLALLELQSMQYKHADQLPSILETLKGLKSDDSGLEKQRVDLMPQIGTRIQLLKEAKGRIVSLRGGEGSAAQESASQALDAAHKKIDQLNGIGPAKKLLDELSRIQIPVDSTNLETRRTDMNDKILRWIFDHAVHPPKDPARILDLVAKAIGSVKNAVDRDALIAELDELKISKGDVNNRRSTLRGQLLELKL